MWVSEVGHTRIMGVSLTAGPKYDLMVTASGYSQSGQHPGAFL